MPEDSAQRAGSEAVKLAGIALGILVVLLLAAGAAYLPFADRGGSDTPEGAVSRFLGEDTDRGMLDRLASVAPAEITSAVGTLHKATAGGADEPDGGLLGIVDGFSLNASNLEMEVTARHDEVAMVTLTSGTITIGHKGGEQTTLSVEQLHLELVRLVGEANNEISIPTLRLFPPDSLFLMTVENGGEWYVSPSYTAAEYGRLFFGLPEGDYARSREAAEPGAESPSAVIGDIVERVNGLPVQAHWNALVAGDTEPYADVLEPLLPPDELGAFIDYLPAYRELEDRFGEAVSEAMDGAPSDLSTENLLADIEVTGRLRLEMDIAEVRQGGGTAVLSFQSGWLYGRLLLDTGQLQWLEAGEIAPVEIEIDVRWHGLCISGTITGTEQGQPPEEFPFTECPPDEALPDGFDEAFIIVPEVDGTWYLSWLRTLGAHAEMFLQHRKR